MSQVCPSIPGAEIGLVGNGCRSHPIPSSRSLHRIATSRTGALNLPSRRRSKGPTHRRCPTPISAPQRLAPPRFPPSTRSFAATLTWSHRRVQAMGMASWWPSVPKSKFRSFVGLHFLVSDTRVVRSRSYDHSKARRFFF